MTHQLERQRMIAGTLVFSTFFSTFFFLFYGMGEWVLDAWIEHRDSHVEVISQHQHYLGWILDSDNSWFGVLKVMKHDDTIYRFD